MKILLFISLLFAELYQAQICIINDNDGYTNVRDKANQNSKIIGKMPSKLYWCKAEMA